MSPPNIDRRETVEVTIPETEWNKVWERLAPTSPYPPKGDRLAVGRLRLLPTLPTLENIDASALKFLSEICSDSTMELIKTALGR